MPLRGGYTVDDNGEVNQLYCEHLEEYERTQLRALFLQEMRRIEPEWVKTSSMASTESKMDFELAGNPPTSGWRTLRRWTLVSSGACKSACIYHKMLL